MNVKCERQSATVRVISVFFASVLLIVVSGCGNVTDQDLADLQSSNAVVRKDAIDRISQGRAFSFPLVSSLVDARHKEEAVRIMMELLCSGDESKDMQLNILARLGELGGEVEVPSFPLIEKLKDKDPEIRNAVISTLAKLKARAASKPLVDLLEQETGKYTIIWALGEIGDPDAVKTLNRLLASDDKYVKYNAQQALAKIAKSEGENASAKLEVKNLPAIIKMAFRKYQQTMMVMFAKMRGVKKGWAGT
ncbi:MAG: HEAT repeat domain-containing protein [Deltaproteobacteria bacterium]|nr:HEAT repeat domain-containing protein [Deltaproteobacteria bacterium]